MIPRQARLRAAFSSCYPGITPDEWHHALWTREMALSQLRHGGPQWQAGGRVLSDEHFDFQGGYSERGGRRETRRELPPIAAGATTEPEKEPDAETAGSSEDEPAVAVHQRG